MFRINNIPRTHPACFANLLWLALLLTACLSPIPPPPSLLTPWRYADLRLLDPPEADLPSHDIIAVYVRSSAEQLQLRLDLLDGVEQLDYDVYLALQSGPGGIAQLPLDTQADLAWNTLLVIPSHGALRALTSTGDPLPGAALSVIRDPSADALYLSLNRLALGGIPTAFPFAASLKVQVFLTPAGSSSPVDRADVFCINDPPPPSANLLLAFWNAYPAYTPATALRRWDGAHTGPLGGRHGLYNLLRAAQAAQIPLVLLDLKNPASLSALDYAGGLELVQQMLAAGLLILPEPLQDPRYGPADLPTEAQASLLQTTLVASDGFGLPRSPFLYLPPTVPAPPSGRQALFARLEQQDNPASPGDPPLTLQSWQGRTFIPLPTARDQQDGQISPDGLSLASRRRLLQTALYAAQPGVSANQVFTWLGGDLPASAWGDPQSARAAFQWLNAHPWVRPLDAKALLSVRPTQPAALQAIPALESAPNRDPLLAALQAAPRNLLAEAAWQAYQALYAPTYPAPPELSALRQQYTGQVWSLLAAAGWAASPQARADCHTDPDQDGQPECLLASSRFYAQFEIDSATLTGLFARDDSGGVHQLIAPSSQFIAGLSNPDTWNLQAGPLADPSTIPGAFAGPGAGFQPETASDSLVFRSPDGAIVKTFRLTETGLQVSYQLPPFAAFPPARLPLALDPWQRFASGWADRYLSQVASNQWSWQSLPGPRLVVTASTSLSVGDFTQSRSLFSAAEDPNQDFPFSHFVPLPLALVQVDLRESTQVSLQFIP